MGTLIGEIRKLKLANGNHINAIERKKKWLESIHNQLDLLYSNPLRFEHKILALETKQHSIEKRMK